MIRNLIGAVLEAYTTVPKVAVAAPLLLLMPLVAEGAQHAVEWSLGMFSGPAKMRAAAGSEARAAAGLVKVVVLMAAAVFTARFWAYDGKLRRALRPDQREWRLLLGLIIVAAAALILVVLSGPLFDALRGTPLELPLRLRPVVPLLVLLLGAALFQKRTMWFMAGLLGDRKMTVERAAVLSSGRAGFFTAAVLVLAIAPAMALHYGLNFTAVGLSPVLQVLILTSDAFLVGGMAILIGNAIWISYRDAHKVLDEPSV